jgi:hypothetical protein
MERIPTKGERCVHLQYGRGVVVFADEDYTVIEFSVGLKKFVTGLMVISPDAEVTKTPETSKPPRAVTVSSKRKKERQASSKYYGVSSKPGRWIAAIGKRTPQGDICVYLLSTKCEEEAAYAYNVAADLIETRSRVRNGDLKLTDEQKIRLETRVKLKLNAKFSAMALSF